MTPLTHVTEWGLAACAGVNTNMALYGTALRAMTVACTGEPAERRSDLVFAVDTVPTCPRCAVLRDAALEGKLPEGKR